MKFKIPHNDHYDFSKASSELYNDGIISLDEVRFLRELRHQY